MIEEINNKEKSEKVLKEVLPLIHKYFENNETLKRENLSDFIDFLCLKKYYDNIDEDLFWKNISMNKDDKILQKIGVIQNLSSFIHRNLKDKELKKNNSKKMEDINENDNNKNVENEVEENKEKDENK